MPNAITTRFAQFTETEFRARLKKRGVDIADWSLTIREDGRSVATFSIPSDGWEVVRKSLFAWKRTVLWAGLVYGDNFTKIVTENGRPMVEVTGDKVEFGPATVLGAIRKMKEPVSTSHTTRIRGFHSHSNGFTVRKSHDGASVGFSHNDTAYCKAQIAKMFPRMIAAGFVVEMTGEYSFDVKGWAA